MAEKIPFPKQAATACWVSPFLVFAIVAITKNAATHSQETQNIIFILMIAILTSGIGLGIYSLFFFKKIKGILIPALLGLAIHGVIGNIAYETYTRTNNQYAYFSIHSLMQNSKTSYQQTILVRTLTRAPIDKYVEQSAQQISKHCPTCKVLKTQVYQTVPQQYLGIFNQQPIEHTYIAIDTTNKAAGDIRIFFPKNTPQPSCNQLAAIIKSQKDAIAGSGKVSCIEALSHQL